MKNIAINFAFMLIVSHSVAQIGAQAILRDTLSFNYAIRTDGFDEYLPQEIEVIYDSSFVRINMPQEQILRTVVGYGISEDGERILRFTCADGIRFSGSPDGRIVGAFVRHRKRTYYLGYDKSIKNQSGWKNRY